MQITIITGISGSGKTQAARFLEDKGYFVVDNLPPSLISKIAEILSANPKYEKLAAVVDTRVGGMINELIDSITAMKSSGINCTVLYMTASDDEIVRRYKETRRSHPVANKGGLLASIREERDMLKGIYEVADYVIDTSNMSLHRLNYELSAIFTDMDKTDGMKIYVMAFGFKYGLPLDADLVFDVRCFPNPFYIDDLKHKTGNDKEVRDYLMGFPSAQKFIRKLEDMMEFLIPLYIEEGKNSLTIAIGCTGGKHRSVTMANNLAEFLTAKNYTVSTDMRDIDKK